MPLDVQPIEVPYGALDTHTDPAEIPIGALTIAENVSSQVDGRYSKRFGYELTASTGGTTAVRLVKRDDELILFDNSTARKFNRALDTWTGGTIPVPNASVAQEYVAIEQSKDLISGTRATYNGVTLHAWIDSTTRDVYAQLFSNEDHTALASYKSSAQDWDVVHVATVGTRLVLFYSSATGQLIEYTLADPATLTFGSPTTFKTGADVWAGSVGFAPAPFDIWAVSSTDVFVAWASDTPDIRLQRHNVYTNTATWASVVVAAEEPVGGIAVYGTTGEFGCVFWNSATTTSMRVRGFNPASGAMLFATVNVENTSVAVGDNFNCGITRISSTSALLVWDRRMPAPEKGSVRWGTISSIGAYAGPEVKYNVWMATKPFTYDGNYYVNVFAPYDTQETFFTLIINKTVTAQVADELFLDDPSLCLPIAMHSYRTAHSHGAPIAALPDIDTVSAGVFAFDCTIAYKFLSSTVGKAGVASYTLDFTDPKRFLSAEIGNSVFMSSGVTFRYDGGDCMENNFLLYPEITAATPGAVGGGGMDNGVYSYIVVFESSDSNGNVDRSTTSLPVSATTSAGAGLGKVDLAIDYLTITQHISQLRTVVASIFRTEASGSTYYFVGSQVMDRTGENFVYTDQANDSTITSNRIVYTQGGILDREPAPPSREMIVHQNRLWGVSAADRKMVFYSGDYLPGESPWFSLLQQFRIDPGGDITALASLDEQLIIFKEDRIFRVLGRGPNNSGVNNDLTPPAEITSDCGCIDPRSVVVVPQGVMFQSHKGIYLLTRGQEVTPVGLPVDSFLESFPVVTAAVLMPSTCEVRVDVTNTAGDEGMKLVYNYRDNRWTTHTNCDATSSGIPSAARVDALVRDTDYLCVDPTGAVLIETPDEYRDLGEYISSRLATGWVRLAGKQGLIRVQRMLVLNEIQEEHDLEVAISKDYVDVAVQTTSLSAADIAALPEEQIAIHIQNQQGEAFKVDISDSESSGSESEGFWARGITFVAGAKRGSFEKVMQAGAKA